MKPLLLATLMTMAPTANAATCFLLSTSNNNWDHASERLCLDEINMLVDPEIDESPSNPRITKTQIKLYGAHPLERHVVATYILDLLPSEPGSTNFGVSVPSNSIFQDMTISFQELNHDGQRHLRGRVRVGSSTYYYRSVY